MGIEQGRNNGREAQFTPVDLGSGPEADMGMAVPNRQQQDKMLYALSTGDPAVLKQRHFEIMFGGRDAMIAEVAGRQLSAEDVSAFLAHIKSPVADEADPIHPRRTYSQVASYPQQMAILADFAGFSIADRNLAADSDLGRLLEQYPDPVAFENREKKTGGRPFMDRIAETNSPEKVAEYERSMRDFKHTIYGKRQEYLEQYKLIFGDPSASRAAGH